jgi:uncharacterized membrane protein YbhN (UPF0104 family)
MQAVSAMKWRLLVGAAGGVLPVGAALRFHFAGLFANLWLPSLIGGDLLRAGLALRGRKGKAAVVLGSLVDRLSDLTALGSIALAGLVLGPVLRDATAARVEPLTILAVLFGGLLVTAGTGVALLRSRRRRWPRRVQRIGLKLLRAGRAMGSKPMVGLAGLGLAILLQAGFVLINVQLGAQMELHMALGLWFLLWPLAKVAAMLPVSLGGLGVREATFGLLVTWFAPGVDPALAVAQSFVWYTVLMAGGLASGAVVMTGRRAGESVGGQRYP